MKAAIEFAGLLKWVIILAVFIAIGFILYKIYSLARDFSTSVSDTVADLPNIISQKWEDTKQAVKETVYSPESLEFQARNEQAIQGYSTGYATDLEDYEMGLYMAGANPETLYAPAYLSYQQAYQRLRK